jgi:predicted membrane protein
METFENNKHSSGKNYSQYMFKHQRNKGRNSHHILGLVLIIVGSALILKNIGIFPRHIEHIIFSWQMLLIAIGLVITLGSDGEKTSGLVAMAVGAFFLVPKIFKYTFDINIFWPAVFIVVGLIFIFSRRSIIKKYSESGIGDDFIDLVHIFSGSQKQIISDNFKGGKITAIFGGSEIDLTQAKLVQGVSDLEITCVFGGVTLIVPGDWNVRVEVTPVLGGFDERQLASNTKFVDMSKTLIIKGTVVFGGGEIKRY